MFVLLRTLPFDATLQLRDTSSSECKLSACVYQHGGVGGDQVIYLIKPDTISSPPAHFSGKTSMSSKFGSKMSLEATQMPRGRSIRSCRYVLYYNTASGSYIQGVTGGTDQTSGGCSLC